MRVFLFRCAWKKALNPPKKGLLVRVEAMETSKRRRIKFDFRIQLHSKGSSEGSGTIPEVPDESKDNSGRSSCSLFGSDIEVQDTSSDEENKADAEVTEKQAGYVQTSLTLSSAELEIQSMVDVPFIKRTLMSKELYSLTLLSQWLLKRQHQHPHHQPHKLMFKCVRPLAEKTFQEEFRSAGWSKENRDG
ncbi:hypothetical protein Tco_1209540 [Tanacetum coccineum]